MPKKYKPTLSDGARKLLLKADKYLSKKAPEPKNTWGTAMSFIATDRQRNAAKAGISTSAVGKSDEYTRLEKAILKAKEEDIGAFTPYSSSRKSKKRK